MNAIKVFFLSYIRRYRIVERNNKFAVQKFGVDDGWTRIGWQGISRDNELYHGRQMFEYCMVDTMDHAVARYHKYIDYLCEKRRRNKTFIHAMPALEPKAWRLLKAKHED